MKIQSTLRNEGKNIVYYLNGRERKLSKPLLDAIRDYGIRKFDDGIRHQKHQVLAALGVEDDADSWI